MALGAAHGGKAQEGSEGRSDSAGDKEVRTQAVVLRSPTRGPGSHRHGEVACEFVEAHGESALAVVDEVHFHDHGAAPSESLVESE